MGGGGAGVGGEGIREKMAGSRGSLLRLDVGQRRGRRCGKGDMFSQM